MENQSANIIYVINKEIMYNYGGCLTVYIFILYFKVIRFVNHMRLISKYALPRGPFNTFYKSQWS